MQRIQKKPAKAQKASKPNKPNLKTEGAFVAQSVQSRSMAPKINNGLKSVRISHRELVGTINGNTTFGATAFALNPGLATTFPWLATVASAYEQYAFRKLRFHYVTRCATSYNGSILLAPEYDALDAAPTSEVFASMMNGAVEDAPWRDQNLDFVIADMHSTGPRKFIRTGAITASDLKAYDVGQLFVCAIGCADANAVGKLWVDYEVEFFVPQNPSALQLGGIGSASYYKHAAAPALTSAVALRIPFDTLGYDGIGLTNSAGAFVGVSTGSYLIHAVTTVKKTAGLAQDNIRLQFNRSGVVDSAYGEVITPLDAAGDQDACQVSGMWYYTPSAATTSFQVQVLWENGAGGNTAQIAANSSAITITRIA
jgi:hypothetical protein